MNPYFVLETPERLDGWSPLATLTDPDVLRARASAVLASLGTGPLRAAGSVDFLGVCSRVLSPALASLTTSNRAPVLTLSTAWWRPAVPGPMRLGSTSDHTCRSLTEAVVDPVIVPLVSAYAQTFALSRKVLWGDVASALNGAAVSLGRGRRDYRRRTCCLLYRLDRGGRCGDCVLDQSK